MARGSRSVSSSSKWRYCNPGYYLKRPKRLALLFIVFVSVSFVVWDRQTLVSEHQVEISELRKEMTDLQNLLEELNNVHGGTVKMGDSKGTTNKSTKQILDDPIDIERREKVKEAMLHAWSSYEKYAWGQDELMPQSKSGVNSFGGLGATLIDSLDTLYIMGLDEQFQKAREWVANSLDFNKDYDASVFETTIRVVGGLLSTYDLSGDKIFLDKARDIADRLLPAWNTPSGIPYNIINLSHGRAHNPGWTGGSSILADSGTEQLEFIALSQRTGDPKYQQKVENVIAVLNKTFPDDGLLPIYINPHSGTTSYSPITFGAMGDSFYEYLLKVWVQGNKTSAVKLYSECEMSNSSKRRYVPPTQSDTVFRITCPASKSDDILTLSADGVNILIEDYAGDATSDDDHRMVVIISSAAEQLSEESPAQLALIRVFDRMVEKDEENKSSNSNLQVGCRLVAPCYQVGCVLGRGGKIIEKIRQDSGAQIRVSPKDHSPIPLPGDEFIQITGNYNAVKKALLAITSCLQDNVGNSGSLKSPGGAQVEPYPQRGPRPPDHYSRGYSSFPGSESVGPSHRQFVEEEVVFKMLCQHDKVGSLIGKGGSMVRALQNETGASIQIVDVGPDTDERVVVISALENSEQKHSPTQDAVFRVHGRLTEIGFEQSNAIVARLLVRSPQVGCLLGKGGHVISEMRRATGASIRIFSKEQIKFISHNEELVQVIGTLQSVQDALFHITSRIRETIFPMKNTPSNFSAPPHVPPFPETPPPLHMPRNHMMPSGHAPPPPPHGIDHSAGPPMPVEHHQHAFSHGMGRGPPNMDRVPYPHGYEGPNSPRSWNTQAPNRGNPGVTAGMNGNPLQNLNSSTVEITIPHIYLIHVYGENSSNLNQIRQISGANVVVHDPKPGATEGQVIVSGTQDQIHSAQCLTQGFILCGQTAS